MTQEIEQEIYHINVSNKIITNTIITVVVFHKHCIITTAQILQCILTFIMFMVVFPTGIVSSFSVFYEV